MIGELDDALTIDAITASAREPDDYLISLLISARPLTAREWAYIETVEALTEGH